MLIILYHHVLCLHDCVESQIHNYAISSCLHVKKCLTLLARAILKATLAQYIARFFSDDLGYEGMMIIMNKTEGHST